MQDIHADSIGQQLLHRFLYLFVKVANGLALLCLYKIINVRQRVACQFIWFLHRDVIGFLVLYIFKRQSEILRRHTGDIGIANVVGLSQNL